MYIQMKHAKWLVDLSSTMGYPKVSIPSHNETNNNNKHLRSNTKGYGGKTH
jgi:hypothetical protein